MPNRPRRLLAVVTLALGVSVLVPVTTLVADVATAPPAGAVSAVDAKRAEAAKIQAQIAANGDKISRLAEQYNGAIWRLEQAGTKLIDAQAHINEAEAQYNKVHDLATARATSLYKSAGTGGSLQILNVEGFSELGSRTKYASIASDRDDSTMLALTKAKEALEAEKAALREAKASAEAERSSIAASKSQVEAANAEQQKLLQKANGELASLVKAEADRVAAAAAAAAALLQQQRNSAAVGARSGSVTPANLPPPSGKAAVAVGYAQSQLGKPYQYAGAGPNTFDCSGLTMMAWAAAGVSMPHYSGAQARMFPRVPDDQLAPGDLLFSYSDLHHVGMYVGNGMMIHAPQTGDVVKYAPAFRLEYQFAVRPG